MNLRPLIRRHLEYTARQMVDADLETTRVYWRRKFWGAAETEAHDPRPFADVLAERGA